MLTFFTTAKPFRGHDGIIPRKALESWTLLDPDAEVILFGDEEGRVDTAKKLALRHEPRVACNEFGTKRLDFMFWRTQAIAWHDLFCYINCGKCFRHPPSHPWTYGQIMTRRNKVYSHIRACSALVFGYHHLHLFDDARRKRKAWSSSSSERP